MRRLGRDEGSGEEHRVVALVNHHLNSERFPGKALLPIDGEPCLAWVLRRAKWSCEQAGVDLQYQTEVGAARRLLYDFLSQELKGLPPRHQKFRANRSMRDVEPSVNLWLKTMDNLEVEEDEG
jgi:hypothetical protein